MYKKNNNNKHKISCTKAHFFLCVSSADVLLLLWPAQIVGLSVSFTSGPESPPCPIAEIWQMEIAAALGWS